MSSNVASSSSAVKPVKWSSGQVVKKNSKKMKMKLNVVNMVLEVEKLNGMNNVCREERREEES